MIVVSLVEKSTGFTLSSWKRYYLLQSRLDSCCSGVQKLFAFVFQMLALGAFFHKC